MPELKHHFRAGKMNKDLDERLVPNGEYRDAQNIEISVSEGSDVGAVQNIRGNTKITGKTYNSNSKSITANWGSQFGLTNPVCIGHVLNNETDKIYWFIKADEADCIAEYDDNKGVISPVLVDANNILDFAADQYITGINVLEGMLFWTDNKTEPKKIDIEVFKSGCNGDFTTHTKYDGEKILPSDLATASAFTEEHITVAKQAPYTAPTLTMATSKRGGSGTGTEPCIITNSTAGLFADVDGNGLAAGTTKSLHLSPQSVYQVGDILVITATYEEQVSQTDYEIKARVTQVNSSGGIVLVKLQSVPTEVAYVPLTWEVLLEEEGVLFEKKMVRFGYRWKYTSGEYSVYSPFSEIAFRPTTFEYLSSDGYNVGMINNLRDLTITIPTGYPIDGDEIDILYKESNSTNIYVVDSLKRDSYNNFDLIYNLTSDLISKTVESNQILRPYDNVPKLAKSQEITANRLIYGNYLQQYDIPNYNLPDINLSIDTADITTVKEPELSIKSLRTYQVGVVYLDKYNRQTPVFTSKDASIQVSKAFAPKVSTLKAICNNTPPSWATHFKYYVKETSNEYYNLAMDRYYLAEDGNVWLSFPSSERNKVQEDMYLILKKGHDNDDVVADQARYKILDIENEAPDFIKLTRKALAAVDAKAHSENIPQVGSVSFKFLGPDPLNNPAFAAGFTSDNMILLDINGNKTEKYDIVSGGFTGEKDNDDHIYQVTIGEPIREGETMLAGLADGDSIRITVYEQKFERKPEHYGRFFVKINRDGAFDTNIIEKYAEEDQQWGIKDSRELFPNSPNTGAGSDNNGESWFDTRDRRESWRIQQSSNKHPKQGRDYMTIIRCGAPGKGRPNRRDHDKNNTINSFLKALTKGGTYMRFKSKAGQTGEIYETTSSNIQYDFRRSSGKKYYSAKRRKYKIYFRHWVNQTPYEDTFTLPTSGSYGTNYIDEIQILEKVIEQGNEQLTSDNPAIWETEPKEAIDLDLYYETGNTLPIADHGSEQTLVFKNCYSYGNGVETDRLRDDFNAVKIDKGVKVSSVLAEQYKEERRKNGLIFSGLFNSTSGVNRLNQFIQGEAITKDLNPHYGGIQKLLARNTDLIAFCEDKVLKILANKDALYEAGGNTQLTATNRVLGQAIPFVGNYGISKNPESLASYAFRVYFTDRNRGAVLRLSRDGLTAISENGMRDYFKDNLPNASLILGSYDGSKGLYNLTLNNTTVSFDEKVNGWPSFKDFVPEAACALNNKYFSIKNGEIWVHTNEVRNDFYGAGSAESSITLLINDAAETVKGFKTLNYSGSRSRVYTNNYDAGNNYNNPTSTNTKGWYCDYINTDQQEGFVKEFLKKENRYYNNLKGVATQLSNLDSQEFSVQGLGQFTGSLAGDVSLDDREVTVQLTGIANTTVEDQKFDVSIGSEIHSTKTSQQLTIIPNTGATVTAGDLSVSSTGTYVDSVTFAQSGDNVIATVNFTDGVNMPSNDLTIALAVTGDGQQLIYRLHDLNITSNTDANITRTITYSGSGNATAELHNDRTGFEANYDGTTFETIATVKFDLASNFDFTKLTPQYKIIKEDDLVDSAYQVTFVDQEADGSVMTIGSGGKTLADVDKRIFTIKYKFPAQDTAKDHIEFNASSVASATQDDDQVRGYNFEGGAQVGRFEQNKNLKIYGSVGAKFSIKQVIDSGTAHYWDGDSWETGGTTLTIPSAGVYTISIPFYEVVNTSVSHVYTLEAKSPSALLSPLMGNVFNTSTPPVVQNPFTINQLVDIDLTVSASSTSGDFTITSSNFVKSNQALMEPEENSEASQLDLTITATATGNISQSREPETEDFTNYTSNSFIWEFDSGGLATINNTPATKTVSITGTINIEQYGTADTTSNIDLDDFLTKTGGSGGGGSILLNAEVTHGLGGYINIGKLTYNDGTYSTSNGKVIHIGVADNTSISGTGTIFGNFYGNNLSQITLTITPGTGNTTNTSCFDNMSITKGTLTGTDGSQDLTYTWSAQFDETVTSSSIPTYNVNVALANEP